MLTTSMTNSRRYLVLLIACAVFGVADLLQPGYSQHKSSITTYPSNEILNQRVTLLECQNEDLEVEEVELEFVDFGVAVAPSPERVTPHVWAQDAKFDMFDREDGVRAIFPVAPYVVDEYGDMYYLVPKPDLSAKTKRRDVFDRFYVACVPGYFPENLGGHYPRMILVLKDKAKESVFYLVNLIKRMLYDSQTLNVVKRRPFDERVRGARTLPSLRSLFSSHSDFEVVPFLAELEFESYKSHVFGIAGTSIHDSKATPPKIDHLKKPVSLPNNSSGRPRKTVAKPSTTELFLKAPDVPFARLLPTPRVKVAGEVCDRVGNKGEGGIHFRCPIPIEKLDNVEIFYENFLPIDAEINGLNVEIAPAKLIAKVVAEIVAPTARQIMAYEKTTSRWLSHKDQTELLVAYDSDTKSFGVDVALSFAGGEENKICEERVSFPVDAILRNETQTIKEPCERVVLKMPQNWTYPETTIIRGCEGEARLGSGSMECVSKNPEGVEVVLGDYLETIRPYSYRPNTYAPLVLTVRPKLRPYDRKSSQLLLSLYDEISATYCYAETNECCKPMRIEPGDFSEGIMPATGSGCTNLPGIFDEVRLTFENSQKRNPVYVSSWKTSWRAHENHSVLIDDIAELEQQLIRRYTVTVNTGSVHRNAQIAIFSDMASCKAGRPPLQIVPYVRGVGVHGVRAGAGMVLRLGEDRISECGIVVPDELGKYARVTLELTAQKGPRRIVVLAPSAQLGKLGRGQMITQALQQSLLALLSKEGHLEYPISVLRISNDGRVRSVTNSEKWGEVGSTSQVEQFEHLNRIDFALDDFRTLGDLGHVDGFLANMDLSSIAYVADSRELMVSTRLQPANLGVPLNWAYQKIPLFVVTDDGCDIWVERVAVSNQNCIGLNDIEPLGDSGAREKLTRFFERFLAQRGKNSDSF